MSHPVSKKSWVHVPYACEPFILSFLTYKLFFRNWLMQKKLSKGPYKILLNSSDITLSHRADTSVPRKVSKATAQAKRKVNLSSK